MNAKVYGKLAGLVLWPAFACLSIWLVAGEMPPAIEKAFVFVLWGLVVILLIITFGSAILFVAGSLDMGKALAANRPDRIYAVVVTPSRLILILAMFFAGKPILAGSFIVGFLGLWSLRSHFRKRAVAVNE